jgi:uncharacterized membrane protein YtjA (UPF0391 family)
MLPPGTRFSKVHHRAQSTKAISATWHPEGRDAMARQGLPASARAAARPSGFPAKGRPIVDIGQRAAIRHHPSLARYWNQFHRSKLDLRFRGGRRSSGGPKVKEWAMTILRWALLFFLISVVAGVLGFTGISAASADIARFLFYVFIVIFLVLLILGLTIFRV